MLASPLARNGGLTASLHFALGLTHFELKQYAEAAKQLRHCLSKRNERVFSPVNADIRTARQHGFELLLAKLVALVIQRFVNSIGVNHHGVQW